MNDAILNELAKKNGFDDIFTSYERYLPYMKIVKIKAKTEFFSSELTNNRILFFTNGRFVLYSNHENGLRSLNSSQEAPCLMGDLELFIDDILDILNEGERDIEISLKMITDCTAIALNYSQIRHILMQDNKFLLYLCRTQTRKLIKSGTRQVAMTTMNAKARIADCMILNCNKSGYFEEKSENVAGFCNVSYRHLNRLLKEMTDCGLIERKGKGFIIKDMDALKEIAAM